MILDDATLSELKELLNEEFQDIIQTFVVRSEELLVELEEAVAEQDDVKIESLAHSLKGSCLNVGAVKLSEHCIELEQAVKENDSARYSDLLIQLKAIFMQSSQALLAWI